MGLFDSILSTVKDSVQNSTTDILNNVKGEVINETKSVINNKVNEFASKTAESVSKIALKKVLMLYLQNITNNFNGSEEEKLETEEAINTLISCIDNDGLSEEKLAEEMNKITNMLYKQVGKPETASSTDIDIASKELITIVEELTPKNTTE